MGQDRYELIEELGRGSQGITYVARDLESGERVAIKALAFGAVDDWKAMELFEREARVLESIDHARIPGYIDTYTVEEDGDVRLFLVQEYVEGQNLSERLEREGRWSYGQAREALDALLPALEHIHGRVPPIVHRDIKPSNVLESDDGELFLIDFGAVQAHEVTTVGGSTVIGTPGYMPTEQMIGRAQPSSDLYSLGVTLAHMITGVAPTDVDLDEDNTLDYAALLDPNEALTPVLLRMIEPTPRQRFASVSEVVDALGGAAHTPPADRARAVADWDAWARETLSRYKRLEVFEGTDGGVYATNDPSREEREAEVARGREQGWRYEGSFTTWAVETASWALTPFVLSTDYAFMSDPTRTMWYDGHGMIYTFFDDGQCVMTGATLYDSSTQREGERLTHHRIDGPLSALASEHARHVARRVAAGARPLRGLSARRAHTWALAMANPPDTPANVAVRTASMVFLWSMLFIVFIPMLWTYHNARERLAAHPGVRRTRTADALFAALPPVTPHDASSDSTGVALDFGEEVGAGEEVEEVVVVESAR